MKPRFWTVGAVGGVIVTAVLLLAATILETASIDLGLGLPILSLGVVGAVIVTKRPGNGVGVVMMVAALCGALYAASDAYAGRSVDGPTALPLEHVAAWLGAWLWVPLMASFATLLFVFPSGRAVGRWRWVFRALLSYWVVVTSIWAPLLTALSADTLLAIARDEGIQNQLYATGDVLLSPTFFIFGVPLGVVALLSRFRRSSVVERQQLKWLLWASALGFLAIFILEPRVDDDFAESVMWTVVLTAYPVAVGIAILRYQLYDIDRIISRTVTYTVVAVGLALVFAAGAVWFPTVLPFDDSSVAVAATTLVVFVLFQPLRRRVQNIVDRRFHRLPYDSEIVRHRLQGRLRDQLDPDSVAAEWQWTVTTTVQPSVIGRWVREESVR